MFSCPFCKKTGFIADVPCIMCGGVGKNDYPTTSSQMVKALKGGATFALFYDLNMELEWYEFNRKKIAEDKKWNFDILFSIMSHGIMTRVRIEHRSPILIKHIEIRKGAR